MGEATLAVRAYSGTLASLNLGGALNQSVLNGLGPSTTGTIVDDDGVLDRNDTATLRFGPDGVEQPITYLGTGTISTLGLFGLKLDPRPITIFQAGGQIYFSLPNGLPLLSAVTFSIDVNVNTPATLPNFDPDIVPCFAGGTRILTRRGNIPVENVKPGDHVVDTDGTSHEVLWVGARTINLQALSEELYQKLVPVRINAALMPDHTSADDLVVSQQHRIRMSHPLTETLFGIGPCFVPAVSLVGKLADFATDLTAVTYHHILCETHVTLRANGIAAESLFLGDVLRDGLRPALQEELRLVFPQFDALAADMRHVTSLPTLKTYEADLLARMVAKTSKGIPAPVAGYRPALTPAFD